MIIIKRLYLENYKLFSQKEIDFSPALLSVFDGPNGYGKTSIFDAAELLITGNISRVKECQSVNGSSGYETIFFAKNSDKDVVLKAEFVDKEADEVFTIGAKAISANLKGKLANPKSIYDNIDYYLLPSYEISIEAWTEYVLGKDQVDELRRNRFGRQNLEQFTLFHYIRQEDRLAYFKQNESSRSSTIENLLGVDEERKKQKEIQAKYKAVDKLIKQVESEISKKKDTLIEPVQQVEKDTEYKQLLESIRPWDQEHIAFSSTNAEQLLVQYNKELEEIENYIKYKDNHVDYFAYRMFCNIPEQNRADVARAWILLQNQTLSVDEIEMCSQNLNFLQNQKEQMDSRDYLNIDFVKMCNILGVADNENILKEIAVLRNISQNQGELQRALNNLIQIRENLHREHNKITQSGVCPYCGYDWSGNDYLEEHFKSTKKILQKLLAQDGEKYSLQVEKIEEEMDKNILPLLINKINELLSLDIIRAYCIFDSKAKFVSMLDQGKPMLETSKRRIIDDKRELVGDVETQIAVLLEECYQIGNSFSNDYLMADEKYHFENIRQKYGLMDNIINRMMPDDIEQKKQYILVQFYESFDKLRDEIETMEKQKETLSEIKVQLKEYSSAYNAAIEAYKKQIIDEIEIPFFVYSSRLLQSYQGGQGVLMENDGESIRFKAPGKEHDILYTMSSGQLSAVLLSFSLALNKIYASDGIKTVMIDDPIQCMDDINMISFVELLRREFDDCQIILSTHEEDFSNFIRYKFKKYGLVTQAITLKDA